MSTNRIGNTGMIGILEVSTADLEQVVGGKGVAAIPAAPAPPSLSLSNAVLGHVLGVQLTTSVSDDDPVLAHVLGVDGAASPHAAADKHAGGDVSPVWSLFGGSQA